ncbi:MAG: hypothetical protein ACI9OJ_001918 [Myxococcota bacterium]|jgi:hypothetical protein
MAFKFGQRGGMRTTSMPEPSASAAKWRPNLPSLWRMRNLGPSPNDVASRSCCAAHRSISGDAADGLRAIGIVERLLGVLLAVAPFADVF